MDYDITCVAVWQLSWLCMQPYSVYWLIWMYFGRFAVESIFSGYGFLYFWEKKLFTWLFVGLLTHITHLFIYLIIFIQKYHEIYRFLNISVRELLVHIDNSVLCMYATFCRNTVICVYTTNYFCDITMKITFLISSFFHE